MMRDGDSVGLARAAGRVEPPRISDPGVDPGLVVRDPVLHPVAETADDGFGVLDERLRRRTLAPAAEVLQGLGRVPVKQRCERLDAIRKQLVDQPVVEVEPCLVDVAASLRQHAWPRDREAEHVEPELLHQADVVRVAVVEVARDRAGVAAPNLAGGRTKAVPDALAAAVYMRRAFDLVRGRRRTPDEVGGERARVDCHGVLSIRAEGAVTWQRADWRGRASTSGGVMWEQTSIASGHRLTKRQPSGGSTAAAASPLRAWMRSACNRFAGSGTAASKSLVYGCSGDASTSSTGPRSTICPAYMTSRSSAT